VSRDLSPIMKIEALSTTTQDVEVAILALRLWCLKIRLSYFTCNRSYQTAVPPAGL